MKIKKMAIKKKGEEGFPIKGREKVKRKRSEENRVILDQWKKENKKSSDQMNCRQDKWLPEKEDPFSVSLPFESSFSTGDIPPHLNKEEKTETPSFLSKNTNLEKILLVRDRTFDLWFDRKSCAKWSHGAVMVRVKHWHVWVFIRHEWFIPSFSLTRCFPCMFI